MTEGTAPASERNGYIDQWRGISVLLVIVNHLLLFRFRGGLDVGAGRGVAHWIAAKISWVTTLWAINVGSLGVCIFFVISGFLITSLMLKEEGRRGGVSLTAFYLRRCLRIIPPMLLYVIGAHLLSAMRAIQLQDGEAAQAALFLCNTTLVHCGRHFGQLWSLAVEEQFYLLWPLLFVATGRFRVVLAAAIVTVAVVVSTMPALRVEGWLNNGLAFACISTGALYALSPRFRLSLAWLNRVPTWALVVVVVGFVPFARTRWQAMDAPMVVVLPFLITALVVARTGKVWEAFRLIGRISYSLYLWHVVFTWEVDQYLSPWLYYASPLALVLAWFSYRWVELPCIRLGHRLSSDIVARPAVSA